MCWRVFGLLVGIATSGIAVTAQASEFAAGGLVLRDDFGITVERQDLFISPDAIRVTYVLRSDTAQEGMLAFPMPPVPVEGGASFLGGGQINEGEPRNYMHFSAKVDGRPVEPQLYEHAYVGEIEIGRDLKAAGLPLLISPADASDMISALPAEQFFALEDRGIVSRGGDDPPHFLPLWSYQTVYEWRQAFPQGRTTIEISYVPLADIAPEAACVDDETKAEIAKHQTYEAKTIGYILSLDQSWKSPIGEFNMIVDKGGEATMVTVCPPGLATPKRNFTPSQDIAVTFYYFR